MNNIYETLHTYFLIVLLEDGWNYNGAEPILDSLLSNVDIYSVTKEMVLAVSADYKDR